MAAQAQPLAAPLRCDMLALDGADGRSSVGGYAASGSFGGGIFGRVRAHNGIAVCGGIGTTGSDDANAAIRNSLIVGGSLGWELPDRTIRPFIQVGGWIIPDARISLNRSYLNGTAPITVGADTGGRLSYFYVIAGVNARLGLTDALQMRAELGRSRVSSDAYSEVLSPDNPFEAHSGAGNDSFTIAKFGALWRHRFGGAIEFEVRGDYAWGFNRSSRLTVSVPGFGAFVPAVESPGDWTEYGARLGYRFSPGWRADVFVNGMDGGDRIGSDQQIGLSVSASF